MKKGIIICTIGVISTAAIFAGCGSSNNTQEETTTITASSAVIETTVTKSTTIATTATTTTKATEYDELQGVFKKIGFNTTEDELLNLVNSSSLTFTDKDYNGTPKYKTYKIAFTEGVANQGYADEGDNIEVSFSKEDGSLMYANYSNHKSFKSALIYNYGNHFDLTEKMPSNTYTGYYYYTPGGDKDGIVIEHSNGSKTETAYHKCNSVSEAIDNTLE